MEASKNIEAIEATIESAYHVEAAEVNDEKCASGLEQALQASRGERQQISSSLKQEMNLFYGELPLKSLLEVLEHVPVTPSDIFYDLGSGRGKVVLAVSHLGLFSASFGIEILGSLHGMAAAAQQRLQQALKCPVIFTHGDILKPPVEADWTSWPSLAAHAAEDPAASAEPKVERKLIVFACSTAFDEALMKKIASKASGVPVGTYIITVSQTLKSSMLKLMWSGKVAASWGEATAYVYKKEHNRRLEDVLLRSFLR